MAREFFFNFTDGGSLDRLGERISGFLTRIRELRNEIQGMGGTTASLDPLEQRYRRTFNIIKQQIEDTRSRIELLNKALATPIGPDATTRRRDPLTGAFASKEGLEAQRNDERRRLADLTADAESLVAQARREATDAAERDLRVIQQQNTLLRVRDELLQKLDTYGRGGKGLQNLFEQRRQELERAREALRKQLADEQTRLVRQTPSNIGEKIFRDQSRIVAQTVQLERDRVRLTQQLAQEKRKVTQADLQQRQAVARGIKPTTDEAQALDERRGEAAVRLASIRERLEGITANLARLERERVRNQEQLAALEQRGQAAVGATAILSRISDINRQLTQLDISEMEDLNKFVGTDVLNSIESLSTAAEQFRKSDLVDPEEIAKFNELRGKADQLFQTLQKYRTAKIPQQLTQEEMFAGIPLLERTLLGAFKGFQRRFQATLQFAISGALIFQTQRLAREFVQAAIDVQRTFADIETSLEFDIPAPRGTAEFEQVVERIRRGVLGIADDFNVLPEEANKVAYQMVSRFQDTDAAIEASRAVLLAYKVSTIDVGEAQRALTAIGESYGDQINDSVSAAERQLAIAKLYTQALDGATIIQQKYGIALEDTIEGTAGLAEVFNQLGFSLSQTQAILAVVSQRTGAEGSAIADRVGRALAVLTDPSGLKSDLLDLAAANSEFALSYADFDTGAEALQAIIDQYPAIQQANRALASEIAQIIGQRRETRFIVPILESGQLIDQITRDVDRSTGAAEQRWAGLKNVVDELTQSIATQFQELAGNLERIGFLTPIQLFLQVLDKSLGLINSIAKGIVTVKELLNEIRIPFLDKGLGDVFTVVISLTAAVYSLKRAFEALSFVQNVLVGQRVQSVLSQFKAARDLSVGATVAVAVGGIGGTGIGKLTKQVEKLSTTAARTGRVMTASLITPLAAMRGAMLRISASIAAFTTALAINAAAARGATIAEGQLAVSRTAGVLGNLRVAITGLRIAIGPILASLAKLGLAIGVFVFAYQSVRSLIDIIRDLTTVSRQAREREADREQRRAEILEESIDVGDPVSNTVAAMEQLREELSDLNDEFGDFDPHKIRGFWRNMIEGFIAFQVRAFTADDSGFITGATAPEIARFEAQKELIQLQISEFFSTLQGLGELANTMAPETIGSLEDGKQLLDNIAIAFEELMAQPGFGPGQESGKALDAILDRLAVYAQFLESSFPSAALDTASTGSPNWIRERLQAIQQEIQLLTLLPEEANKQLAVLKADAERGIEDAQTEAEKKDFESALRDIQLAELSIFQGERDFAERLAALSDQPLRVAQENLAIAKRYLERAIEEHPEKLVLIRDLEIGVLEARKEYTRLVVDEATARLQLATDTASTLEEQRTAWLMLKAALMFEIVNRVGIVNFLTGNYRKTLDEERRWAQIIEGLADNAEETAILGARNAVLLNNAALNEIAAIDANIAVIRVRLGFEDDINRRNEIYAELRQELARKEEALARRRAAYWNLIAGTGNSILAAQAALKIAIDNFEVVSKAYGAESAASYEAELAVLKARESLANLAREKVDLQRRLQSDITDSMEQAYLDVAAARDELAAATGDIERLRAEKKVAEAEADAQKEFYNRRESDLDFLFRTDQIGRSQYIAALRSLQSGIDRTTRQGEELWREIELQIRGLQDSAQDAFNIPTEIRLPTLFEVRRALAADALGVNYQDNRQQDINLFVTDELNLAQVLDQIETAFGGNIDVEAARLGAGGAQITIGGF